MLPRIVPLPRFYAPSLDQNQPHVILSAEESHHLLKVLRLGVGDEVAVFDGRGHEFTARVERVASKAVTLSLGARARVPSRPAVSVVLVQAVLKGDKMDDVVRDATMAAVTAIVPVVTERSLVSVSALARSHAVERWQRIAIASAKQCRRADLPSIDRPQPFRDWLASPFDGQRLVFVEPASETGASGDAQSLRRALPAERHAVACVIGPEGGWSNEERQMATAAGCAVVTMGPMTLRADAAGLVAVSLVNFVYEDGRPHPLDNDL
jgi:16S rRNA (uracil1498-N3)-methyltransferase